jgi:hypothetical protein
MAEEEDAASDDEPSGVGARSKRRATMQAGCRMKQSAPVTVRRRGKARKGKK